MAQYPHATAVAKPKTGLICGWQACEASLGNYHGAVSHLWRHFVGTGVVMERDCVGSFLVCLRVSAVVELRGLGMYGLGFMC